MTDLLTLNYAHRTSVLCDFSFGGREYLLFIEDHAFSPPYNLAPPSAPLSHPPISKLFSIFSQFFCVSPVELTEEKEREEVGDEPN